MVLRWYELHALVEPRRRGRVGMVLDFDWPPPKLQRSIGRLEYCHDAKTRFSVTNRDCSAFKTCNDVFQFQFERLARTDVRSTHITGSVLHQGSIDILDLRHL